MYIRNATPAFERLIDPDYDTMMSGGCALGLPDATTLSETL